MKLSSSAWNIWHSFWCFIFIGEEQCSGHEHFPIVSLDEVFHMSCDQIYKLLFTESNFISRFNASRKTTGKMEHLIILLVKQNTPYFKEL